MTLQIYNEYLTHLWSIFFDILISFGIANQKKRGKLLYVCKTSHCARADRCGNAADGDTCNRSSNGYPNCLLVRWVRLLFRVGIRLVCPTLPLLRLPSPNQRFFHPLLPRMRGNVLKHNGESKRLKQALALAKFSLQSFYQPSFPWFSVGQGIAHIITTPSPIPRSPGRPLRLGRRHCRLVRRRWPGRSGGGRRGRSRPGRRWRSPLR